MMDSLKSKKDYAEFGLSLIANIFIEHLEKQERAHLS